MTIRRLAWSLAAALALAGCDRTIGASVGAEEFARAFAPVPGAPDRAAEAAAAEAASGGLVSARIGARLDEAERQMALQAALDALDNGKSGAPVAWKNPASGRYGNVIPGPAYARQGSTCRGFSHTVTVNGQIEIARGTACRSVDGGPWLAAG